MITKKKEKKGVNNFVAAITGAVVGAGVAVAGAIALKDKKNRDKVTKVINDVKNQTVGYVEKIQKEISTNKKKIEKNITKGKAKVKKIK